MWCAFDDACRQTQEDTLIPCVLADSSCPSFQPQDDLHDDTLFFVFGRANVGGPAALQALLLSLGASPPDSPPLPARNMSPGNHCSCSMITLHVCTMIMMHTCTMILVLACTMIIVHACTMIIVHAYTMSIVPACTEIIVHACTMIIVRACTMIIVHACPMHVIG